ncbi:MAG TPA: type II CAAX endopeptidase family protein [Steroidobacteraceae bacterium]
MREAYRGSDLGGALWHARARLASLTILPFALLLAAVVGLWIHRAFWITALVAAMVAGYCTGALRDLAALWVAIAAALCLWYSRSRARAAIAGGLSQRLVSGALLFIHGICMAVPLLPGFVRVELVPAQVLSEGAAPYALSVGFPKVTLGILLLGLVNPSLLSRRGLAHVLVRTVPVFATTLACVVACALSLGYTRFAPHWHVLFLAWAPINLLFSCLSEEAFFRGFVQQEMARDEADMTRNLVALGSAALLFGLAHYAGGPAYVFTGVVAGLGYGWAFLRTRRIEAAVAVHFGVNAAHFLLFVYPRPA